MASLLRLLLFAGLLLFLFFGDAPERSRFWSAFFDAGHTALFGVIALLIRGFLFRAAARRRGDASPPPGEPARLLFLAFALTVFLGGATELVQVLQRGGDPSLEDLARDTLGAGAFLTMSAVFHSRGWWRTEEARLPRPRRRRLALSAAAIAIAAGMLLLAGKALILTSAAYLERNRAFPTLYPLDGSRWERVFIHLGRSGLTAPHPPAAPFARLDLRPGRYAGITFAEPYPDWRGYRRLVLVVVSDLGSPLPMSLRVHDAAHNQKTRDRFNRVLTIQPGVNRIAVAIDDIRRAPAGREMDLRRVRGIILFVSGLARPAHVYLGPVTLER